MGVRDAADIFNYCVSSGDEVESGNHSEELLLNSFSQKVFVNGMNPKIH